MSASEIPNLSSLSPDAVVVDTVDVHAFGLTASDTETREYRELLDEAERLRAKEFLHSELCSRWIVCRGRLRKILARYCDVESTSVRFATIANGKPIVGNRDISPPVHFNLSHSGDIAVVAVCRSGPIGVDVEHIRAISDIDTIAERFFAAGERNRLLAMQSDDKRCAFYRCWTRKESVIKATGEGLQARLDSFEVSLSDEPLTRLRSFNGDKDAGRDWQIHRLRLGGSYEGAVAIRSRGDVRLQEHYELPRMN